MALKLSDLGACFYWTVFDVLNLCGVRCAKFEVDAWMDVSENSQITVWKFHNRTRWKYNEILKLSSLGIYETQNSEKFLNKCWVVCLFKKFYKYCCLYFTGRLKRNIKMFSDFIYESYKMVLLLLGIARSSRLLSLRAVNSCWAMCNVQNCLVNQIIKK